jgi:osmotically-inducible protein OsmY
MAAAATFISDQTLRDDILYELKYDPKIVAPEDIAVSVKDGVVTLTGFISSSWQKDEAEKAAKRVYGVRAVANDIVVRPSSDRSDGEIAKEAVDELDSHIFIPGEKIKVSVSKGWVTLDGEVRWHFQRRLAESAVKSVRGVTGVTNQIRLTSTASPGDIKRDIENALKRSAEVEARRIAIEVDGGTVRLYGTVRSWLEKDAAEDAAWSSPGVTQVENLIEVAP